LTTGFVEGTVHDASSHTARQAAILIKASAGFSSLVHTSSAGQFTLSLPYGRYLLWNGGSEQSRQTAFVLVVAPLQTISVDLVIDSSGSLKTDGRLSSQQRASAFGLWADATRAGTYPEGFSWQSALVSREPGSLTVPLDFTGLANNRLGLVSQTAFSWTGTEFKFQGLNATDSYQPGRPAILPDVQALSHVIVRTGSALITSTSYNNEVGSFVAEPGSSWHGGVFISGTGSALSSSNLPPPQTRGAVERPEQFNWFTRDRLEVGGPLTHWADLFASGAGQWASQTIQLAPPDQDQNSRVLFGTGRSRVRAGSHDQLDAEYSGARVDLSNWGTPAGIEALAGRRMSPEFNLPDGFPGQAEADHLNFFEVGWTHLLSASANLGVLQVRYGYSLDHFFTWPAVQSTPDQSRIELLGSTTAGAPPLDTLALRPRHEIAIAWESAALHTGRFRHHITAGGSWNVATPVIASLRPPISMSSPPRMHRLSSSNTTHPSIRAQELLQLRHMLQTTSYSVMGSPSAWAHWLIFREARCRRKAALRARSRRRETIPRSEIRLPGTACHRESASLGRFRMRTD
jgi:hypothetical protein